VTRVLLLALIFAAAGAAGAAEITLPPDHPYGTLKPGPGSEVAQRSCVLCHSTDYIVKMIKVFGAPVSDADAKTITEYLARQYGK
jgi:hypothetical protein